MSGVRKESCVYDGPVVRSCGHETRYQCRLTDDARRQAAFTKLRGSPCPACRLAGEEGVSSCIAREVMAAKLDGLRRLAMAVGKAFDECGAPDSLMDAYLKFIKP